MLPTFSLYAQTYPKKMLLLGLLIFLSGFALWVHFFLSSSATDIPRVAEPLKESQQESFEAVVQRQIEASRTEDIILVSEEAVTRQLEALTPKKVVPANESDIQKSLEQLKKSNN